MNEKSTPNLHSKNKNKSKHNPNNQIGCYTLLLSTFILAQLTNSKCPYEKFNTSIYFYEVNVTSTSVAAFWTITFVSLWKTNAPSYCLWILKINTTRMRLLHCMLGWIEKCMNNSFHCAIMMWIVSIWFVRRN